MAKKKKAAKKAADQKPLKAAAPKKASKPPASTTIEVPASLLEQINALDPEAAEETVRHFVENGQILGTMHSVRKVRIVTTETSATGAAVPAWDKNC